MPVHLTCTALGCGRKPESLQKTHTDAGERANTIQAAALAGNQVFSVKHNEITTEQNDTIQVINFIHIYTHTYICVCIDIDIDV